MTKTVAIVGAGPAGLTAARAALEFGLSPTIFEKSSSIGGLWNELKGVMWNGMTTNLSYRTCSFSDHPWPRGTPDFPSGPQVGKYLRDYSDRFQLGIRTQFRTAVCNIARRENGWIVRTSSSWKPSFFDYVIIASGFFSNPYIPRLKDKASFEGRLTHSSTYYSADYSADHFKGQNVVVVGNAFSGAEIASDLAGKAGSVTNLIRSPYWILPRYFSGAVPLDRVLYNREGPEASAHLSPNEKNNLTRAFFRESFGNPGDAHPDLTPDLDDAAPLRAAVAPTYLEKVRSGSIRIHKGEIERLVKSGLIVNPAAIIPADSIICATGYRTTLPYLDRSILRTLQYRADDPVQPLILHKATIHPDLPGMAFVGMYKGSYFGVMEMQAQWAAALFSGKVAYPARAAMEDGLQSELALRKMKPRPQFPHGDYVQFYDSIAGETGRQWRDPFKSEPPSLSPLTGSRP